MDLTKIYPPRPDWVHKGNFGSVLVVAGSKLYTGSATLVSVAAVRAGADLVTVCAPERAANVAANTLPDLITLPLKGSHLSTTHVAEIMDIAHVRKINSVVIGCGLGRHQSTMSAVYKLIQKVTVPLVIDADALFAVSKNPAILSGKQTVLTPHLGELAILLKKERIDENFNVRLEAAKQAAEGYKSVILLKGHIDIITDGVVTITNNTGTPYMTKGGFGDTLAGVLGALLSRGMGIIEAAHAAAYINGRAGELASERRGEAVAASDIFETLPEIIKVDTPN